MSRTTPPLNMLEAVQPARTQHRAQPFALAVNTQQSAAGLTVRSMTSLLEAEPLYPGEWLETFVGSQNERKCRRHDGTPGTPGTRSHEYAGKKELIRLSDAESPGETQRQTNGLVSLYQQKPSAEWETGMCDVAGLAAGDYLAVYKYDGPSGAWGYARSVLAKKNAGTAVAICTRVIDSSATGARIQFQML